MLNFFFWCDHYDGIESLQMAQSADENLINENEACLNQFWL